jgi:flavorubredoxin
MMICFGHTKAGTDSCLFKLCRLEIGTTYNSYLIFGDDKTALVDASHEKFHDLYLDTLKKQLKKAGRDKIDYIIVSHTEPDHSGLIQYLVDIYPDVIVAGSKVCPLRGVFGISLSF